MYYIPPSSPTLPPPYQGVSNCNILTSVFLLGPPIVFGQKTPTSIFRKEHFVGIYSYKCIHTHQTKGSYTLTVNSVNVSMKKRHIRGGIFNQTVRLYTGKFPADVLKTILKVGIVPRMHMTYRFWTRTKKLAVLKFKLFL